jgi:RND family efflux transporter MFP subunit
VSKEPGVISVFCIKKKLKNIANRLEVRMNKRFTVFVVLLTTAWIVGCTSEEQETRSIEQIYADEGVPVRIQEVERMPFAVEKTYFAVLTGLEESNALAHVADQVEKIYVKVGDYVKKDQTLLTFPTDNPNAQYYQAKVAFENARLAYERLENMYESGGVSKQQLDNTKAQYDVAAANWDAARQAVIVRAPINGYVTSINVRESDNVKRDAELVTISRMDRMKARVWIAEKDAPEVEPGLTAYAVWNDIRIDGQVVEVDMALNQQRQAFGAMLEFDNPQKILKFDITAEIFIRTYQREEAVVVEYKDLLKESGQYFVYLINDNKAVKRQVIPGRRQQMNVEILEGLQPGDQLVVEGQMLLEDQSKVKIIQ